MGFFSWLTADTQESISNLYSERGARPVYLLQPGGQDAILEPQYQGNGNFGNTDAYKWLAQQNLPAADIAGMTDSELYAIGLSLDLGKYYRDKATGALLTVFHVIPHPVQKLYGLKLRHLPVTYGVALPEFGNKTANDLIADGSWENLSLPRPKHELKLSFDANARYEDLSASASCPDQGFFYE